VAARGIHEETLLCVLGTSVHLLAGSSDGRASARGPRRRQADQGLRGRGHRGARRHGPGLAAGAGRARRQARPPALPLHAAGGQGRDVPQLRRLLQRPSSARPPALPLRWTACFAPTPASSRLPPGRWSRRPRAPGHGRSRGRLLRPRRRRPRGSARSAAPVLRARDGETARGERHAAGGWRLRD
jgi:hypothetical protein